MTTRPSKWRRCRLGDLFKIRHGYAFKGEFFAEKGPYIVLTPGNFYDEGGFKHKQQEKYYTGDFPPAYLLSTGDLIIAMTEQVKGLLGSSALVPEDNVYLHNQRLGLVTDLDVDQLVKRFLYYLFNYHGVRDQIQATANGAKIRHTSPTRVYDVAVSLPSVECQQKIASILSAYDRLIENKQRRIAILEETARLVYTEWFVHYRFPGHEETKLVDSELGKIPKGWGASTLGAECQLVMGQSPKSEFYNLHGEGLPFHQGVTNFGARFPRTRVYCTAKGRIAEEGDVLFSVRAPVGRINVANDNMIVGRGLAGIRHRQGNQCFTLHQMMDRFQEEDTMGGGTIFKAVTKTDMMNLPFMDPPASLIHQFESICGPMDALIDNLDSTGRNLRQARDLLLPKLFSGEVDVSDLDIVTGEEVAA